MSLTKELLRFPIAMTALSYVWSIGYMSESQHDYRSVSLHPDDTTPVEIDLANAVSDALYPSIIAFILPSIYLMCF